MLTRLRVEIKEEGIYGTTFLAMAEKKFLFSG
jgi:hypothetical protein